MNSAPAHAATTIDIPVLIVGGGGCGLTTSCLLSDLGVDHVLVERHASTSLLPKAHYLNQRTMEIYRQHGLADAVYEKGAPVEAFSQVRWRTTLGGTAPLDARDYHVMDSFGGGSLRETYQRDSPCDPTRYPQMRLEPLLREYAEKRAPGRLLFSHELVAWEQHHGGVTATIQPLDSERQPAGAPIRVNAQYVVCADGGKTMGPALGIPMEGPSALLDMVSVHFSADLSQWWEDGTWAMLFTNPDGAGSWGSGNAMMHGPTWNRHSEQWNVHFAFGPDDPARFDEDAMVPRLRRLLKLPDLELEVHAISHWIVDRVVAQHYQEGKVFLAGDAAHRQPPTSGLGLNTAIQDAHNLAWKLAAVLNGSAEGVLLDTYEQERRPIGIANADWALLMFHNHSVIDASIGIERTAPKETNIAALEAYFAETPRGESLRARAAIGISTQEMEFHDHAIEIGFHYEQGALVSDETAPPQRDPLGKQYRPTTRPGHRLPHAWLTRDKKPVSTHDLVRPGRFSLLTDTTSDWATAAQRVSAALGTSIDVFPIGDGGLCTDPAGRWSAVNEIGPGGAVLIRPDHHVAWRTIAAPTDLARALSAALERILR